MTSSRSQDLTAATPRRRIQEDQLGQGSGRESVEKTGGGMAISRGDIRFFWGLILEGNAAGGQLVPLTCPDAIVIATFANAWGARAQLQPTATSRRPGGVLPCSSLLFRPRGEKRKG